MTTLSHMQKILLLLSLTCFAHTLLLAQGTVSIHGIVREQNSNKKPLAAVQVIFTDAVPAVSDQAGNFRLVFSGKMPGDLVFLKAITKAGYELVNKKELERIKIGNAGELGFDVILAKSGSIDAAKKRYYEVSDSALLAYFNREKQKLTLQIQKKEISAKEYENQLAQLKHQYESQKEGLGPLAETFARINFDDVGKLYQEALVLFKSGEIDLAIKKLEEPDLRHRFELRAQERERIRNLDQELTKANATNEEKLNKDMAALYEQAKMYTEKGDVINAKQSYDALLKHENIALNVLEECAAFYQKNNLPELAIQAYNRIIDHPLVSDSQKAKALQALTLINK